MTALHGLLPIFFSIYCVNKNAAQSTNPQIRDVQQKECRYLHGSVRSGGSWLIQAGLDEGWLQVIRQAQIHSACFSSSLELVIIKSMFLFLFFFNHGKRQECKIRTTSHKHISDFACAMPTNIQSKLYQQTTVTEARKCISS